ncbi:MAG: hypothetical protein ACYSUM_04795 [Planctomycetota bacterium]
MAEVAHSASDPVVAPGAVLAGKAADGFLDLARDSGPSGSVPMGGAVELLRDVTTGDQRWIMMTLGDHQRRALVRVWPEGTQVSYDAGKLGDSGRRVDPPKPPVQTVR